DFAGLAVANGAAALVVERELDIAVPQLVVASARAAMAAAADAFYGRPSRALDVVGITGTNGKTTTAFLMHAVLEAAVGLAGLLGGPVLTYAARPDAGADVRPHAVEVGSGGAIALIVSTPRGPIPLDVRLRGGFNVENVLCAVTVSELLELPHAAVRAGIAAVPGVPGRFEAVE